MFFEEGSEAVTVRDAATPAGVREREAEGEDICAPCAQISNEKWKMKNGKWRRRMAEKSLR